MDAFQICLAEEVSRRSDMFYARYGKRAKFVMLPSWCNGFQMIGDMKVLIDMRESSDDEQFNPVFLVDPMGSDNG